MHHQGRCASVSAPTRGAQEIVSPSYRDVVMDRARAESPITVDEGESPRSCANRRLEEDTIEVEGTPSYELPPPAIRDAWSVVLQKRLARRARAWVAQSSTR